jgi:hypothetical protein
MRARSITVTQTDGVDQFIKTAVILLASSTILLQKKAKNSIKMDSEFMKKFINFSIDIK